MIFISMYFYFVLEIHFCVISTHSAHHPNMIVFLCLDLVLEGLALPPTSVSLKSEIPAPGAATVTSMLERSGASKFCPKTLSRASSFSQAPSLSLELDSKL